MVTISLCMIVRNEENSLPRCLASVKDIVDEIIIVDTGSEDTTKEIAESMGAVIYDFTWIDDFSAARNYSFSKATKEYILWLDADDIISEQDQERFKLLKSSLQSHVQTVSMQYNLAFDSVGKVTTSLRRNRLVRRDCNFQWIGPVHEYLAVWGESLASDVCINHSKDKHYTDRNLKIYRKRVEAGEEFSPRDLYYYANELRDHSLHLESSQYYQKFLDTGQGWIEDNFQACLKLAECHAALGDSDKELTALTRTLQYDKPRAEFCYRLGNYFTGKEQYQVAIYWYELAISLPDGNESMGMRNIAASTWLPHLQLAICYDRTGEKQKGNYHNELALHYFPAHPSMIYNRSYFKSVLGPLYVEFNSK